MGEHMEEKSFLKTLWKKPSENIVEKGEIAQNEQFHIFPPFLYATGILKSCNCHISVLVCNFFQFEMVSKWCIGEWVNKQKYLDLLDE